MQIRTNYKCLSSTIMQTQPDLSALNLRPANEVMRLKRMGSFHQSRLSFMRVLLRRLKNENWQFSRPIWQVNADGVGVATYQATGPRRSYTLVAFAHDLPDEKRSDRVIAEAWDSTFTLFDGIPNKADIERLSQNVPLQEAGRISDSEFVLARANRSVRLFEYVIDCLAKGEQPDQEPIESTGYLMRTSAVYGSAKFGAADRQTWADRPEFVGSFQPELLTVWLIRAFTIDLVEHLAKARAPKTATTLAPELRHRFGVGNSTGLGMAPFLLNHPALIHAWVNARETALAQVRAIDKANAEDIEQFEQLVQRAQINAKNWVTQHPYQTEKITQLQADFDKLLTHFTSDPLAQEKPWNALYLWAEQHLSLEGQEQLVSLIIEPYGEMIDQLSNTMCCDEAEQFCISGAMTIKRLQNIIEQKYGWALDIDFDGKQACARIWYVSEEKLEPRLGERHEESIANYEQALAPARDIKLAYEALQTWDKEQSCAQFLMRHPEYRHVVRRLQLVEKLPYAEVCDNTIAHDMLPIDLLRCKLSFFGATHFDPRSDRWVRITMFQGAPFPHELADIDPDDCAYPPLQST